MARHRGARECDVAAIRLAIAVLASARPFGCRGGLDVGDDDGAADLRSFFSRLLTDRPTAFIAPFCAVVSVAHASGGM